jgi:hypothetical protein
MSWTGLENLRHQNRLALGSKIATSWTTVTLLVTKQVNVWNVIACKWTGMSNFRDYTAQGG